MMGDVRLRCRRTWLLGHTAFAGIVGATAVMGAMVGVADPAFAGCTVTGDVATIKCDNGGVVVKPNQGDVSLGVDGLTISGFDNKIDFFPDDGDGDVFGTLTLSVSNTTITTPNYGGINIAPVMRVESINVTLDPTVSITNNGGFGGLWVRASVGGDITITSGAEINSTGSSALSATTNDGGVSIDNSGDLYSSSDRGIYADGGYNSTGSALVSVINSGDINAYTEGIRMVQWHGDIYAENSGDITSQTQRALYAWSASVGNIEIINSGSAVSLARAGAILAATTGNAKLTNSGRLEGADFGADLMSDDGDLIVTNTATGQITGATIGLQMVTAVGDITVGNAGTISGASGIAAETGDGSITVDNTGTITATAGTGVSLTGDSVTLTNSGTITATGGNAVSLAGDTTRLILKDGSSITGNVVASGDATLELDFSSVTTLDASLLGDTSQYQGFDTVAVTGSGEITFDGNSTYAGLVSLTGGNVIVDGDLRYADFLVGTGVQLSGTGSVGDLTVGDGGSVAPGHSPGTMYVYGDLNFLSGSTYVADLTTTGVSDNIVVSGDVNIASGTTLSVANLRVANPLTTVYELITLTGSGAVTGSFTALRDPWSFIDLDVNYNASSVTLGYEQVGASFANSASGANARSVGRAIDSLGTASSLYDDLLWSNGTSPDAALEQVTGAIHAAQIGGQVEADLLFNGLMLSHLNQPAGQAASGDSRRIGDDSTVWMSAFGRRAERDGDNLGSDMTDRTRGVAFGATTDLASDWRLGLAAAIGTDRVSNDTGSGRSEADSYFLGLSAARAFGAFNVSFGGAYTVRSIDTTRSVALGTINEHLTAGYDARSLQAFGEVSTVMGEGDLRWQPFGNLTFVHYDSDAFTETGGTTALGGQSMADNAVYSTLGVRLAWDVPVDGLAKTAVTAHAGWRHAFGGETADRQMAFLAGGDSFTIAGVKAARDVAAVGLGLSLSPTANSSLSIGYDGQFGDGTVAHGVKADWKVRF
ncbi:autotransporter domain-containing protein [Rhizobium sp. CSW-27]|uniref:autotransporter outer membrane beta-barrel domain-containing protein n=1 Tax=Rhizobium sp. CSW-27 TaxID=2839985 RepID=UPI001C020F73|nr:autotransporter domain-containing protein [Rhizobium sp. CSW-27]MBT9370962.1 autotransporter domain-containing protein [Rhizobium sp. CSW-27]